jgi:hypothetical protein
MYVNNRNINATGCLTTKLGGILRDDADVILRDEDRKR